MAATEIERLIVRLAADTRQFSAGMQGAVNTMQKTAARIGQIGRQITTRVTLPLTVMGGAAVKSFADFDQAMTESTSIMKVTADQTQRMRDTALELSGAASQAPAELARSYFFLASAGLDAEQSIAALPQVTKFATAGAFDMALATDLLTDAQSALGLTSKDAATNLAGMARLSDVLVKANILANASVQQFSESLTNTAAASLRAFGKDAEEGVAVLAAFADQGVKGAVAGTNLSRIMLLLSKSSRDNAAQHQALGFSVFDASGEMRNFADIVKNLEDVTRGMSDEVKAATLEQLGFEARVQQAILPLLGTSDAIRRYETELRKAGGTTDDVANKQMASFSNQMKIVRNQVIVLGIQIGEVLAPIVIKIADGLKVATEFFKGLSPEAKRAAVLFGLLAAAAGPVAIALSVLSGLAAPMAAVGAAIAAVTVALEIFGLSWGDVFVFARDFFLTTIGFFANFRDNMTILMNFLRDNWRNVLSDMVQLLLLWVRNSGENMMTMIRTAIRLWVAWQGFMAGLFQRVFSVDFVKAVIAGITVAARKIVEFAAFAADRIRAIFTRENAPSLNDFFKQIQTDFEKGASNLNFFETAADILKEEAGNLRLPFAGFESAITNAPAFKTDLPSMLQSAAKAAVSGAAGTASVAGTAGTAASAAAANIAAGAQTAGFIAQRAASSFGSIEAQQRLEEFQTKLRGNGEQDTKNLDGINKGVQELVEQGRSKQDLEIEDIFGPAALEG